MKYLMLLVSIGYMILVVVLFGAAYQYRADLMPFWFADEQQVTTTETITEPVASVTVQPEPVTAPVTTRAVIDSPDNAANPPVVEAKPTKKLAEKTPEKQAMSAHDKATTPASRPAVSAVPPAPANALPQRPVPTYGQPPVADNRNNRLQPPMPMAGSMPGAQQRMQRPEFNARPPSVPAYNAPAYTPPAPPKLTEQQQKTMQVTHRLRQAMHQRRYADAISAQQELAGLYPENPEFLGQLGDMYFSQRQPKQAAQAYLQACEKFIDMKHYARPMQMLPVIMQLDEESGKRLQGRLEKSLGRKIQLPMMHRGQHQPTPVR